MCLVLPILPEHPELLPPEGSVLLVARFRIMQPILAGICVMARFDFQGGLGQQIYNSYSHSLPKREGLPSKFPPNGNGEPRFSTTSLFMFMDV